MKSDQANFTLRFDPDDFGQIPMALPDLVLDGETEENQQISFNFEGKLQQIPNKLKAVSRTYYEGKLLQNNFAILPINSSATDFDQKPYFKTNLIQIKKLDETYLISRNRTETSLNFIFNVRLNLLVPGMYLFFLRFTDLSDALFLESYVTLKVKSKQSNEQNEMKTIKEYRAYLCDENWSNKKLFDQFCHPSDIILSDDNKKMFLGTDQRGFVNDGEAGKNERLLIDDVQLEMSNYFLQKIQSDIMM